MSIRETAKQRWRARAVSVLALLGLAPQWFACRGPAAQLTPAVKRDIQAQIAARQSAYASCYTSALKGNESLKGQLTLSFVVLPDGQLAQVNVESGPGDARLSRCVTDATSAIVISQRPSLPVQVSCPLNFEPPAMTGRALTEGGIEPAPAAAPAKP